MQKKFKIVQQITKGNKLFAQRLKNFKEVFNSTLFKENRSALRTYVLCEFNIIENCGHNRKS